MNTRSFLSIVLTACAALAFLGCHSSQRPTKTAATQPTTRPLSGVRVYAATRPAVPVGRILIVSIDGLRPDVMLRANAPTLRSLMNTGAFSCWAQTTKVAVTLPSHVSMLTGVTPDRHGINWNKEIPIEKLTYPKAPSLLELAHEAGFTTAIVTGKGKFDPLDKPGVVDWAVLPETDKVNDKLVAEWARMVIATYRPQVMFLHFPGADSAGHDKGWGSPDQIKAVESIDKSFGLVLDALKEEDLFESTAIIVSADHGGAAKGHGAGDERSRYIPWILRGPGVRKGLDLTTYKDLTIHTEDTFATACMLLDLPFDSAIDGKPIHQALVKKELLQDAKPVQAAASK